MRRSCVSGRHARGLIPRLCVEVRWSRSKVGRSFDSCDRLPLGIGKLVSGKQTGIERLARDMRAHTPVHQTNCVFLSANGHGVGVKPCLWNMTPRVCIANSDWWNVAFPFLKVQQISSHFPRRSRSPQALLPGMTGKQIEGSSTKRWISASSAEYRGSKMPELKQRLVLGVPEGFFAGFSTD